MLLLLGIAKFLLIFLILQEHIAILIAPCKEIGLNLFWIIFALKGKGHIFVLAHWKSWKNNNYMGSNREKKPWRNVQNQWQKLIIDTPILHPTIVENCLFLIHLYYLYYSWYYYGIKIGFSILWRFNLGSCHTHIKYLIAYTHTHTLTYRYTLYRVS